VERQAIHTDCDNPCKIWQRSQLKKLTRPHGTVKETNCMEFLDPM
jgi:hypothetical protein